MMAEEMKHVKRHKHNGITYDKQFDDGRWYALILWPLRLGDFQVKLLTTCECEQCQALYDNKE